MRLFSYGLELIMGKGLRATAGRFLLCAVTLEAALLGSGRMLQIGPLTVKMVLFFLMLIYIAWCLLSLDRLRISTVLFVVSFAALLCFGIVIGIYHNAQRTLLSEDVSPLLSFITILFFEVTIKNKAEILLIIRITIYAAIVMVIGYITILVFLLLGFVSFGALYDWLNVVGGGEFIFEGNSGRVFYKGALFIAIALIYVLFRKGWSNRATALILFLSLFFVGSRGFFLALALSGIVYMSIRQISAVKRLLFAFGFILLLAGFLPFVFSLSGDKTESNQVRITTISQVFDRIAAGNLIIGHGFGIGVPERPEHMEITYVEILYKQGMIGLLWWVALISIMTIRFRRAVKMGREDLAYPLFLSAMFIICESATNPFINNPIGMYPFIISFVGLGVLSQPEMPLPLASCNLDSTSI